MSDNINEPQQELPPVKVAFILDNVVVEVLHTDERLGSIFLNNAIVENVTGEDGIQTAWIDDQYDPVTHSFSRDGVTPEVTTDQSMNPIKLALIIDNKVIDVLHTDERLAAIFLSDPIVLDVTGADGNQTVFFGDVYDQETNTFTTPVENERPPEQVNYEGWIYNEELGYELPPIPYPEDGKLYIWDNETLNWIEDKE